MLYYAAIDHDHNIHVIIYAILISHYDTSFFNLSGAFCVYLVAMSKCLTVVLYGIVQPLQYGISMLPCATSEFGI